MKKSKILAFSLKWLVYLAAISTILIICFIVGYILIKGIPHLSWSLFSFQYTSNNVSVFPAIVNTLTVTLLSLLISAPLGIFSALFLVEYTHKNNKFVKIVRITSETLSGIPTIVFGLFGFLGFV
ncbi:MAG: phosphate ABC transporter, permease protein PstA, partial [Bacilli bacterium]